MDSQRKRGIDVLLLNNPRDEVAAAVFVNQIMVDTDLNAKRRAVCQFDPQGNETWFPIHEHLVHPKYGREQLALFQKARKKRTSKAPRRNSVVAACGPGPQQELNVEDVLDIVGVGGDMVRLRAELDGLQKEVNILKKQRAELGVEKVQNNVSGYFYYLEKYLFTRKDKIYFLST